MPGLEIRPFSEEHLDDAAQPLAQRHARHREAEPLLPADVDFRKESAGEWRSEGAAGVFATRGAAPVGYLLASRFWPRRGFRTTFLRLYRSIP
jgi:hypothetical protein